jgi:hypothetical protein
MNEHIIENKFLASPLTPALLLSKLRGNTDACFQPPLLIIFRPGEYGTIQKTDIYKAERVTVEASTPNKSRVGGTAVCNRVGTFTYRCLVMVVDGVVHGHKWTKTVCTVTQTIYDQRWQGFDSR